MISNGRLEDGVPWTGACCGVLDERVELTSQVHEVVFVALKLLDCFGVGGVAS